MTTETQYPQPGPTGLPQFIRAEVERAIAKAVAPTGMSAHDGRALIGHDKLRYMLALIDSQAAKLAAIQAPEGALRVAAQRVLDDCIRLSNSLDGSERHNGALAALRAALAGQPGPALIADKLADELARALKIIGPDWEDSQGRPLKAWHARATKLVVAQRAQTTTKQTKEPTNDR